LDIIEEDNIIIRSLIFDESLCLNNFVDGNCTAQFWVPFKTVQLCNDGEFKETQIPHFQKALNKYYRHEFLAWQNCYCRMYRFCSC
jgi:hypothetical protein